MPIERRPVLASYLLILIGFLLAVVVDSLIYVPPTPPGCSDFCMASSVADLVGIILMVVGIAYLGIAVFRSASAAAPGPGTAPGPVYSFTGTPAPPPSPTRATPALPASPPPATVRYCPACGVPVKTDFGFCPRCGQSIP